MATKKATLATAMNKTVGRSTTAETGTQSTRPPSRRNTRAIAGHFDPAVWKQLRQLGTEREASTQQLLREALNELFVKYKLPPIA